MEEMPEKTMGPGQSVCGFDVKAVTPIEELRMMAYEIEDRKTGARIVHLHCNDSDNLFSISFPTPPTDDTGVPHILEHSVLSGSRKFPVRDPFFEMLKMSPATFINAMTGLDRTYYPVTSNVRQDLFNLADVYFDAVFHPLLSEDTFKREAHHLAPADAEEPTGDLTRNGIVYNEMKSAFSTPESRLGRLSLRSLFPDTTYGCESGGTPESIPELTYQGLKRFHETYYHPSNAYFIFYGDTPTHQFLEFLRPRLDEYERAEIEPVIEPQPRWTEPREQRDAYPIGVDETETEKTFIELSWLTGDGTDADENMVWYLISQILVGHDASPLKKAIVDSHIGQDLLPSGYANIGLETMFRVGVKGSETDRVDTFRKLVLDTLSEIADNEIDPELVEAAFRQSAYYYREITSMQPLMMLMRVLSVWIYGCSPTTFLQMGRLLDVCRERYEKDSRFFNRYIRERLVENPHRLLVVLEPDKAWQSRTDAEVERQMKEARRRLSDQEMKQLAADAQILQEKSGTPNPPEAVATLPQLMIEDMPDRPEHIPTTAEELSGRVTFLRNEVFSNGVNYLHLDFNLEGLPPELWPWLPRYQDTITRLGAAGLDYEQMQRRIASNTGGIGCRPSLSPHAREEGRHVWGMRLTLRVLDENVEAALDVLRDLIFEPDPRDRGRFSDVVTQQFAGLRTRLVQGGTNTAIVHGSRGLAEEAYLSDQLKGIPQLEFLECLTQHYDERAEDLMERVERIAAFLRNSQRLTASFTGSDAACKTVTDQLGDWISQMPSAPVEGGKLDWEPWRTPPREGLAAPIQVAHCARIVPGVHISHPDAPLLVLGLNLLRFDYILSEIRLKGNAYGANSSYVWGNAISLGSYADPHITRTLKVFDELPDYVQRADWSRDEVRRAIVTTVKNYLKPIRPSDATGQALERHLSGRTPEFREEQYQVLLAATATEIKRALTDVLDANMGRSAICVLSSREKLEQANKEMAGRELEIRDVIR